MYEPQLEHFVTPRGRAVNLWVRNGTNDHNTANSALDEDEYRLADLHLAGQALDVGAHIGAVSVALLADNPDLSLTCIEPVPDNVWLLERNLAENGLTARVLHAAAGSGEGSTRVAYRYTGSENALHHAFIGNATLLERSKQHEVIAVPTFGLDAFVPLAFCKIDCEGGEWDFLQGPALSQVIRIHGEWHPTEGHTQAELVTRLAEAGFRVFLTGPVAGPGGFVAVRP